MPLADLLAVLERDAEAQAEAELAAARAAATRIETDAAARLDGRRADYVTARQAELRAATERAIAEAQWRARAGVLEARQRLLDRVFAAARKELPGVARDPAFLDRLPRDLAAARAYVGDARVTARCRPEIAAAVRALAATNGAVTVVEDETAGTGVRLMAADGSVEVDDTLEARLERWLPRLALAVMRRLAEAQ
ncbi:MAG TPA: V-type ATP synthase subunit E [Gemmatimonadales bacterium]